MRTQKTLQTKRTKPKDGFRILHAATRKAKERRHRAATMAAPEDLGEVPGVGIARALLVILLLHIAAIAGIYLHNSWSKGADIQASIEDAPTGTPPKPLPGYQRVTVSQGDNYENLAVRHGVNVNDLKAVNEHKTLELGWAINIPKNSILGMAHTNPSANTQVLPQAPVPNYSLRERPPIQTANDTTHNAVTLGRLTAVPGAPQISTDEPVYISPPSAVAPPNSYRERVRQDPPRTQPEPIRQNGRSHTVSSGDTLWRIAHNNGVSVDALKRANPSVNVSALKIGTRLVIPK